MKEIKQVAVAHGLAVVSCTGNDDSYKSRIADLKRAFKELDEIGYLDSVAEAIETINREADFITWIVVVAPTPTAKTVYQAFSQGMIAGHLGKRVNGSFSFTSGEYFCLISSTESSLDSFCAKLALESKPSVAEAVDTLIAEIKNK
jgi:hypothetical protein